VFELFTSWKADKADRTTDAATEIATLRQKIEAPQEPSGAFYLHGPGPGGSSLRRFGYRMVRLRPNDRARVWQPVAGAGG
jgi:hypothetical protein